MKHRVERVWLPLAGVLAAVYVTNRGFAPQTVGDYGSEAAPAMNALLAGHLHAFFALQPAYGGSLLLRAPAAALAKALGGGQLAIYRAGTFVCVVGCGLLGAWLAARMRSLSQPAIAWLPVLCVSALAPLATGAILYGHPEEALGAVLCVIAVVLAAGGRVTLAGVALALAIFSKQWGVVALAPALLAVPAGPRVWQARVRLLCLAAALPAAQLVVAHLEGGGGQALVGGAQQAGFAHAFDLWWPLHRVNRQLTHGLLIANWTAPPFLAAHAHELIVALSILLALLVARRHRFAPSLQTCLALLALAFLLRCILDPQDLFYYHLPFLLSLVAWESCSRRGVPWVSLGSLAALWVVFNEVGPVDPHTSADFVSYLAVSVPICCYLSVRLLGAPRAERAAPTGQLLPAVTRP